MSDAFIAGAAYAIRIASVFAAGLAVIVLLWMIHDRLVEILNLLQKRVDDDDASGTFHYTPDMPRKDGPS